MIGKRFSPFVKKVENPKRRFPFRVSEFSACEFIEFERTIPAAPANDFPKKCLLVNSIFKKFN